MSAADQIHPNETVTDVPTPPLGGQSLTSQNADLQSLNGRDESLHNTIRSLSGRRQSVVIRDNSMEVRKIDGGSTTPKRGLGPRPVGGSGKLGMFSGVYVPTCLNVLSILMFLRFGFILGQSGVIGMMGMLLAAYSIDLVTIFSLSAIASNGTVRGGGAYYLISRSLGPEFGGSIGVVFYLGVAFNTGMNAVGLIDCIALNFGVSSGNWAHVLPDSFWHLYLWATLVLALCTAVCLAGSSIFARASTGLLVILLVATLSIPVSALVMPAFESRKLGIEYTGLSLKTFIGNLKPQLTRGSAGSELQGRETFQDLFGILFPATSGIFAGASMSGDLRKPSKSIPRGTLYGLGTTFVLYTLVILAMASTITRPSFARNANVIQDTNMSGGLILAGEIASSLFSTLMGVIGSAKLLQALARDSLLPGFSVFGQGTKKGDEPTYAIFMTVVVAQIVILGDLNEIASFVTMAYLMTFLVMNLACFLLKIGSAPNFRPSFHFFNWQTALLGTVASGAAMFFVDGLYATGCVGILIIIFLIIHYTSPPKSWGDVSQSLIYHQVRKYLLRLKQEHVKFWRPQILLFVNDPRRQYKLIQFCNSMKKGSLYILGHVIVTDDFAGSVPEARRQQAAWTKYIDFSKIKAFVNIAISPGVEWGARNLVLSAGLGGMRPNIAVLGFYNLDDLRRSKPLVDIHQTAPRSTGGIEIQPRSRRDSKDIRMEGQLPTDFCKTEGMMSVTSYVTILEDLLLQVQINVAVAKGFQSLEFPNPTTEHTKKYIDLWPIQMSAEISAEENGKQNVLTTNFDTYTLILQLGVILNTVPSWKKAYKLRVAVFVEYESDVEEERSRLQALLENLRIEAKILVFWLASGDLPTYEIIINGANSSKEVDEEVEKCLSKEGWWDEIQKIRGNRGVGNENLSDLASIFSPGTSWPEPSFQKGTARERIQRFLGLRRLLKKSKRRQSASGIAKLGVNLGMRTHSLSQQLAKRHASLASASEDSASESEDESNSEAIEDAGSGAEVDSLGGAASEADMDDYESGSDSVNEIQTRPMVRRKSHGDSMGGPSPSKKSTGERSIKVPDLPVRQILRKEPASNSSIKDPSVSTLTIPFKATAEASEGPSSSIKERPQLSLQPQKQSHPFATDHLSHIRPDTLSRHASMPKFSSKPVPVTSVATEDGPERSIMFTETPSRTKRSRLPSAYHTSSSMPDNISEASEQRSPSQSRKGSTYSTQSLPLSFNDLPSRAQHLILNELMRSQSKDTAVMFTTLPTPMQGTCTSETASSAYLSDLEVLCKGCPPVLMVHSNSMTVTTSL